MRIDYMTSDKPTSGFTYRGIVADQPPINNNNNHASQFLFKGQWYHVYHNRIVAKNAGIPMGFRRNIALERFDYNPDGSIKKVEYTTDGVPQIGHVNPYARVEGETFNSQSGVETEPCTLGGMNVSSIENGDWVKIKGVDFTAKGASQFEAQIASAGKGGDIELRLGSPAGQLIGVCPVAFSGGVQKWKTASCKISGATGVQDLYLVFKGAEGPLFSLDAWSFR
jgi:arabinoxylan arabinofuranohydrolase